MVMAHGATRRKDSGTSERLGAVFFERKEEKGKSYGAKFPSRKDADMFEMLTGKAIGNATMN